MQTRCEHNLLSVMCNSKALSALMRTLTVNEQY